MLRPYLLLLFFILPATAFAQETDGNFLRDRKTNCFVRLGHTFPADSVTWIGGCKNSFAEGPGTMTTYTEGARTSVYTGNMQRGQPNGKGVWNFTDGRKLAGNFSQGEILNLKEDCQRYLYKNIVAESDPSNMYVGDKNAPVLYYHALVPEGKIAGALVLMPGTWETTEHCISSTQALCEAAFGQGLAVLTLSINQRLTMTDSVLQLMNAMLGDAVSRYNIPESKVVIGGFSMGGLFSLRYTELANEDPARTRIRPVAVFSCDGPCDLANIYAAFQIKHRKFPGRGEPEYGIRELERHCGGSPQTVPERYAYYSCYSRKDPDGGNAKYLRSTPVLIYSDVDPLWWMQNRQVDMYDMNALDQTAMVLRLNEMGNTEAQFINAFGKGYRIEGNRHPHSWSIVDAAECMDWMLRCLK